VGLLEQSFWFDEAMSWRTSILPWDAMLRSLSRNTHPPLYFAVLKAWIGLWGESVTALRSMNVVIAMPTPPFIFLCCREAANVDRNQLAQLRHVPDVVPLPELRKALSRPTCLLGPTCNFRDAGLVACLLFAFSPYQIRLAWEARMYPLLVLLTVASSWLLMRALAKPASIVRWVCFGLASLAMLYTHYFAMFAVAGQCFFLATWAFKKDDCPRRHKLRGCAIATILILGGWVLWLPIFFRQRQRVADGWWTQELRFHDILALAADLVASSRVLTGVASAMCAAALLLVVVNLWRRVSFGSRYLASVMTFGTGLPVAYSLVGTNVVVSRYFAITQVLWLIGVAGLLAGIQKRAILVGLTGMVVASLILFHAWHLRSLDVWARPGIQAAARFVDSRLGDDDQVVAQSTLVYFPAQFHSEKRDQLRLLDDESGASFFAGGPVLRLQERLTFSEIRSECRRLWVISGTATAPMPSPQDWEFDSCHFFPGTAPFQENTSVTQYVRRSEMVAENAETETILRHAQR
jgi:hypothetical protein